MSDIELANKLLLVLWRTPPPDKWTYGQYFEHLAAMERLVGIGGRLEQAERERDAWKEQTERAFSATRQAHRLLDASERTLNEARAALRGLLAEPYGCGFCDSGKLRNPEKGHTSDCPYLIANRLLSEQQS